MLQGVSDRPVIGKCRGQIMLRPIELQPAGMQPTWYANGQRTHCSSGWFCPVVGHLGQACRLSTSSRDLIAIAIAEGGAHWTSLLWQSLRAVLTLVQVCRGQTKFLGS